MLDRSVVPVAIWIESDVDQWLGMFLKIGTQIKGFEFCLGTSNPDISLEVSAKSQFSCHAYTSIAVFARRNLLSKSSVALFLVEPIECDVLEFNKSLVFFEQDRRIASVSFLNDGRGMLGMADVVESNRVRKKDGAGEVDKKLTPIPFPSGPVVLINLDILEVCGGFSERYPADAHSSLREFGIQALKRGFPSVADFSKLISSTVRNDCYTSERRGNDDSAAMMAFEEATQNIGSPLRIAKDVAVAEFIGMSVLIDGTCLGPMEMGTQVQTLFLISSLANHDDVRVVHVALNSGGCPEYARTTLSHPKIKTFISRTLDFAEAPQVDILHRPFQPDSSIPWDRWRAIAKRVVISIQDLIAYRNAFYFENADHWLKYRSNLRISVFNSDAVVVISNDVKAVVEQEQLAIGKERLFVCENGTDHIPSEIPTRIPTQILERQWAASRFMLVLGADYAHKNRDLAVRIWRDLLVKGHRYNLVLTGPKVPAGSSREAETALGVSHDPNILVLADMPSEERNWMMKHASLILYPSGAEGFGFIPFESARIGKPTLFVSFGPLKEVIGAGAGVNKWALATLVDHAAALVDDPDVKKANIDTIIRAANEYTWARVAQKLVVSYRQTLAIPPKSIR